jgi:hypothetical protein
LFQKETHDPNGKISHEQAVLVLKDGEKMTSKYMKRYSMSPTVINASSNKEM